MDAIYDPLVDIFECVENFLRRIAIYPEIEPTPAMAEMVVKIMADLLSVLALATTQTTQGRLSKFSLADESSWLNTWQRNMQ